MQLLSTRGFEKSILGKRVGQLTKNQDSQMYLQSVKLTYFFTIYFRLNCFRYHRINLNTFAFKINAVFIPSHRLLLTEVEGVSPM